MCAPEEEWRREEIRSLRSKRCSIAARYNVAATSDDVKSAWQKILWKRSASRSRGLLSPLGACCICLQRFDAFKKVTTGSIKNKQPGHRKLNTQLCVCFKGVVS